MEILDAFTDTSITIIIILVYCIKFYKFTEVLMKIKDVNSLLNKTIKSKRSLSLRYYLLISLLGNESVLILFAWMFKFYLEFIEKYLNNFLTNSIILHTIMQYDCILRLLVNMFSNQNLALKNAINVNSPKAKIKPRNIVLLSYSRINSLKRQTLFLLQNVHVDLCNYCQDLSKFFSFPIFLCIFYTFLLSVTYSYMTVIVFTEESDLFQLLWFVWTVAFFLIILFLGRNVSQLKDEVNYLS